MDSGGSSGDGGVRRRQRPGRAVTLPAGFTDAVVASVAGADRARVHARRPDADHHPARPAARRAAAARCWRPRRSTCRRADLQRTPSAACSASRSTRIRQPTASSTSTTRSASAARCHVLERPTPVNRVRASCSATTTSSTPRARRVLVDNIPSPAGNHNARRPAVRQGRQPLHQRRRRRLRLRRRRGCAGANDASRDPNVLLGKILRITPRRRDPADNPFLGAGHRALQRRPAARPRARCRETFAWGLRNPFRIAFDPNAAGTRFFINDVGQNVWEEIDQGSAGADYGWNVREGHCANGSTTNCGAPPAGLTNPILDYGHAATGCASITGGAFVPNGVWPAAYDGGYLFADYVCGKIFLLKRRPAAARPTSRPAAAAAAPCTWRSARTAAARRSTTRLRRRRRGAPDRLHRPPTGRRPRVADARRRPPAPRRCGHAQRRRQQRPRRGDTLTYLWNFGDGRAARRRQRRRSRTPTRRPARFTATLRVRDSRGAASAPVSVGDQVRQHRRRPPRSRARGRRSVPRRPGRSRCAATATDAQDGALPATRAELDRAAAPQHAHPSVLAPVTGNDVTLTAPAPGGPGGDRRTASSRSGSPRPTAAGCRPPPRGTSSRGWSTSPSPARRPAAR